MAPHKESPPPNPPHTMLSMTDAGERHAEFRQWCVDSGIVINKLFVTEFRDAGIGITALTDIKPNTTLALTPQPTLINRATLPPHLRPPHLNPDPPLSTHALLTLFLMYEHTNPASKWKPWVYTWPTTQYFHSVMPLLWPEESRRWLDNGTKALLLNQEARLKRDWQRVHELGLLTSNPDLSSGEEETKIDWDRFVYYWLVVNTRSLFYKSNTAYDKGLPKEDCLTLCPFIDYFNHCNNPGTSVTLTAKGYVVKTERAFKKGEQIFVSYGAHGNDFLLVEYGFQIPGNEQSCLNWDKEMDALLAPAHKRVLKELGFWGGYTSRPGQPICFRTQVALRLSAISTKDVNAFPESVEMRRWRGFVESGSGGGRDEERVKGIVKGWCEGLERRAVDVRGRLEGWGEEWAERVRESRRMVASRNRSEHALAHTRDTGDRYEFTTEFAKDMRTSTHPQSPRGLPERFFRDPVSHLPAAPQEQLWSYYSKVHDLVSEDPSELPVGFALPAVLVSEKLDYITRERYRMLYVIYRPSDDYDADYRKMLFAPAQQYVLRQRRTNPTDVRLTNRVGALVTRQLERMYDLFRRRYFAELLRDGQVQLACAVLRATTAQIDALAPSEWTTKDEYWVYFMTGQLFKQFLCSEKFRSERLENLLLKYLAEEGVNMDVVRGVTELTKRKWISRDGIPKDNNSAD
ncbi:SET domain-containing protein [Ascobolus immersus RN42]|uniref:SET domain-containing protein n=1 Tax=Ascobolus immersus RN42 TaxID=1160509 RepID=A0A3N4I9Q8_ASCIM|nr:SET domain-containing protein [Ascobolus immersus RN42]